MAIGADIVPGQEAVQLSVDVPKRTLIVVQRELGRLPDQVRKELAKNIRKALKGPAANIVADFPAMSEYPGRGAPMSGMTATWGRIQSSIRTNPTADDGRAIAVISVAGEDRAFNRTLAITERAGSRTAGSTIQGRQMTKVLQERFPLIGRGGRFIWKSWLKHRPEAIRGVLVVLNAFVDQYNRSIR